MFEMLDFMMFGSVLFVFRCDFWMFWVWSWKIGVSLKGV